MLCSASRRGRARRATPSKRAKGTGTILTKVGICRALPRSCLQKWLSFHRLVLWGSRAFACFRGACLALDSSQELNEFLFPLSLVVPAFRFGELRNVHRTELRSAHRAEFRFFVEVIGKIFVVHRLRSGWI